MGFFANSFTETIDSLVEKFVESKQPFLFFSSITPAEMRVLETAAEASSAINKENVGEPGILLAGSMKMQTIIDCTEGLVKCVNELLAEHSLKITIKPSKGEIELKSLDPGLESKRPTVLVSKLEF